MWHINSERWVSKEVDLEIKLQSYQEVVGHFYQKIAIKELDQNNVGYVSRHRPDHHLKPVGICLVLRFTFTFWCHFHFQQAKSTCCPRAFGIPWSWCWKVSYWPSPPSWCELLHVWGFWELWGILGTLSILRILKNTKKSKKPPGSTQLYSIWDFHAFSQLSLEMESFDFHI